MDGLAIELVMWETVRRDCKYPIEDNNNGYIYGVYLLDTQTENEAVDIQWWKTAYERNTYIETCGHPIIND
tara:strand:- start:3187 stop:3399 length:213 start_codon:yes stop_codon:yes gene_type:complete